MNLLDALGEQLSYLFIIPGPPVPYAAARKGKNGWYDPRAEAKAKARLSIKSQYTHEPITQAVVVRFLFEMPIPKSWPRAKKKLAEDGNLLHTSKPDIDNLIKLAADCIKKIVIYDDSQIVKLYPEPEKRYSIDPKTIIWVKEI